MGMVKMLGKRRISLQWLIVLIFLAVAVFPLLAVGFTALNTIADEREQFAVTQINNQVNQVLIMQDEVDELLQRIAPTNTTRTLVLESLYQKKLATESPIDVIKYLIMVNDAIPQPHTIDIVSLERVVYSSNGGNEYPPELIQSWVKSIPAQKSQAYFKGNLMIDEHQPSVTMVTSIQPIYRSTNSIAPESIIGFVVIHFTFDGIFENPNLPEIYTSDEEISLLKTTSDPESILVQPTPLVPFNAGSEFLNGKSASVLVDSQFQVLSDVNGFVSKVGKLENILPAVLEESGTCQTGFNGIEYSIHYQKVKDIDSYLFDITNPNTLANLIMPYRGKTMIVIVLCLALIVLLGIVITFVVLTPIYQIVNSLDEIQAGTFDWSKRIKQTWMQEFDELVSLFNSFLDSQVSQKKTELALVSSESKYRSLFLNSPIPLVEEDVSGILDAIHITGLAGPQLLAFLRSNNAAVVDLVSRIRIIDANHAALTLLQAKDKEEIQENMINIYLKPGTPWFVDQVLEMMNRTPQFSQVIEIVSVKQRKMTLSIRWSVFPENLDAMDRVVVSMLDITEQEKANRLREALLNISQDADRLDSIQDLFESIHKTLSRLMDVNNFYIANYDEKTGMISFPYFVDEYDPKPPDREFGNGWTELVISSGKPVLITEPMVKTILLDDQQNMGTEPLCWLGVPLIVRDKTIGAVAVQSYSPRTSYTPEDRDLLMIIANQIALAVSEKQTEAKLIHASTHDELTGLFNRAYYETEIQRLGAGRNEPVGVVMMDIDGLKYTNDHFGHATGDILIREAARIIHKAFRSNDVVSRIGGDEFAVLLPESNQEVVEEAIRRVNSMIVENQPIGLPIKLVLSAGGCTTEGRSLREAIVRADQQMYRNKLQKKMKSEQQMR
jgi:diguanylate cyclase (GGDEF)-like protein